MSFFRAGVLLCAGLLAACGGASSGGAAGTPANQTSAKSRAAAKLPDIVDDTNDLALGRNWYLYETFGGQAFRWVDNDAEILVRDPRTSVKNVAIELEAGPSLGTKNFTLVVRSQGRDVQSIRISGRQRVVLTLPVRPGTANAFTLHVAGGGKRVPEDPRILNFRVFLVANADIIDPGSGITLDRNWDVVEHFAGQTFRWVDNDASFTVTSPRAQTERIQIASRPGPGLGGHVLLITVRGSTGQKVAIVAPGAGGNAAFAVPVKRGSNKFVLHVTGGGQRTSADPRILNFRIFSLSPAR